MSFGAMFTDGDGVPFYIDGTMPLTMIDRRSISVYADQVIDLHPNDGQIRFVFTNSNAAFDSRNTGEWLYLNQSDNRFKLQCPGGNRVVNIYIFGYQYQNPSGWGFQVNDSSGRCILTHTSKVLRDVRNFGDKSQDTQSGFRYRGTLNGNWAVAPCETGYFFGVVNQGSQPRPSVARYVSSARFNGSQTLLTSGYIGNPESGASNVTYSNTRCLFSCIDVSKY